MHLNFGLNEAPNIFNLIYCNLPALTFSTGCAATMTALTLLRPGDHVLCASDVYGGTHHLMKMTAEEKKVELGFFDVTRADALEKEMRPNTKVCSWKFDFLLQCQNSGIFNADGVDWVADQPTVQSCWYQQIGSGRSQTGRSVSCDGQHISYFVLFGTAKFIFILVKVYDTKFQKPLSMGIDIVMYSLTKYMNGHSDVIMGALTLNDDGIFDKLKCVQKSNKNISNTTIINLTRRFKMVVLFLVPLIVILRCED